MKILAVSDIEIGFIYSPMVRQRFNDVDLIISCGDLPNYYLEYIISMLDIPLYYVRGNHSPTIEITTAGERTYPWGAVELHRRVVRDPSGLLMAGIEGSLQYNLGPHQYSQADMWSMVLMMAPAILVNKIRYGRYLDIFVSHAPPWGIHDQSDRPHHGIKAFNWLRRVFHPAYHLHGHIHIYRKDAVISSRVDDTTVLNVYGYQVVRYTPPDRRGMELPSRRRI
jgi:Icc-related predicted phosphoesterase